MALNLGLHHQARDKEQVSNEMCPQELLREHILKNSKSVIYRLEENVQISAALPQPFSSIS